MREDHPTVPEKTRASSKGSAFSSIQGRLVSLLLLVLVPIMVAQAYFSYDRYQGRRKIESAANLDLARATAKAFDTFVQDVLHQELAIGLAFTSSQTLSEKEKNRILFENQAGNPAIWHFFWDNPAGIVTAATGSQFIGMDISDREFYREIVAGKAWVVSDLLLSKTTRQPSFTISRGIRNERGELLGIIVAGILPAKLDRVLAVERPGDAGVSLLDSKGMHAYRYPATQYTWEQRNWLKLYPFLEEVAKGKEAVITGHVSKIRAGTKRIVAFTPVPSIGWIASCSRAEKEAVGPIISATLQETGLILLVALVSLLTAFALSRTVSSSVIILRNHALSLGRGETENPLTISRPAEIKDLAEAFNKMAEEMRFREKALRESEERLRFSLESCRIGAWDIDLKDHTAYRSLEHDRIFGYQELLPSWTLDDFLKHALPEYHAPVEAMMREATAKKTGWTYECQIRRADGELRWIWFSGRHRTDSSGRSRVAGVVQDITTRKAAEEALKRAREELELRVEERTAELLKANEALDEFASIASHDMQEPLRKILSFGDQLKVKCGSTLDDTGKDYLERMQKAAKRMQTLLSALLAYSRASRKTEPFTRVDLSSLVRDVLDDLEVRIHQTGGSVELGELPAIEADSHQMRQLFQNLIGNGLKYHGKEKPMVKVYAEPSEGGGQWRIFVEDNGIGFDQKYADRIFAPFQRLHGRSEYEGTGMGLAICKKIMERHGGDIKAKSKPGVGSTFIVTLPKGQ